MDSEGDFFKRRLAEARTLVEGVATERALVAQLDACRRTAADTEACCRALERRLDRVSARADGEAEAFERVLAAAAPFFALERRAREAAEASAAEQGGLCAAERAAREEAREAVADAQLAREAAEAKLVVERAKGEDAREAVAIADAHSRAAVDRAERAVADAQFARDAAESAAKVASDELATERAARETAEREGHEACEALAALERTSQPAPARPQHYGWPRTRYHMASRQPVRGTVTAGVMQQMDAMFMRHALGPRAADEHGALGVGQQASDGTLSVIGLLRPGANDRSSPASFEVDATFALAQLALLRRLLGLPVLPTCLSHSHPGGPAAAVNSTIDLGVDEPYVRRERRSMLFPIVVTKPLSDERDTTTAHRLPARDVVWFGMSADEPGVYVPAHVDVVAGGDAAAVLIPYLPALANAAPILDLQRAGRSVRVLPGSAGQDVTVEVRGAGGRAAILSFSPTADRVLLREDGIAWERDLGADAQIEQVGRLVAPLEGSRPGRR